MFFVRGNKEDYWINRRADFNCEWKDGNSTVGVSLHSGGKAQFMILHQDIQGWKHEFINLDYDKEKVMKEMYESGLENIAPYWSQVTKHLILTGTISHATVLAKAVRLCEEELGSCSWYDVPEKYWEKAIAELIN